MKLLVIFNIFIFVNLNLYAIDFKVQWASPDDDGTYGKWDATTEEMCHINRPDPNPLNPVFVLKNNVYSALI